jgi:hypothetical protein
MALGLAVGLVLRVALGLAFVLLLLVLFVPLALVPFALVLVALPLARLFALVVVSLARLIRNGSGWGLAHPPADSVRSGRAGGEPE